MDDDTQSDVHDGPAAPVVAEPVSMTDDEVAVLAGRRAKAAPIVRRLVAHRPSGATGRLVSEHDVPPRITAKEMASIRRARRSTALVRARFGASDVAAEPVTEPRDGNDLPQRRPTDAR
jgi:hypothetical protein